QLLQLHLLLPVKFQEAWNSGEMRIICEGFVGGAHAVPLENFIGEDKGTYAVSEQDSQILDVVRRLNNNGTPGMWVLSAKNFGECFSSLVGHPKVTLGKTSALQVTRAAQRSRLHLSLKEDGQLQLHLEDRPDLQGEVLQATTGQ